MQNKERWLLHNAQEDTHTPDEKDKPGTQTSVSGAIKLGTVTAWAEEVAEGHV